MKYPDTITIEPLANPPDARICVPGSKSITNRALVLAALSEPSKGGELHGALRSEDTEIMVAALRDLGFSIDADWENERIRVHRSGVGLIPASHADLFVGNSGTTMRFLTAMVGLGNGQYRLDGVTRMRERPIDDLLAALNELGVRATSERGDGYPPVLIQTEGMSGGDVRIRGDISSQFLSGLLMAAPMASDEVTIEVDGTLVSVPYVEMTLEMMWQAGVKVDYDDDFTYFNVPKADWYKSQIIKVEPDASAASYFYGAAAICDGSVSIPGLSKDSLQGDTDFVDALKQMGCDINEKEKLLGVRGGRLHGIEIDMNAISDTVMTLGAVACFANGPTTIRNVAHIRHKETDRLSALASELRRVGATVDEFDDGLTITPEPLHGAEIETYNDHRMAMSMALIGLKVPGIVIKNPGCVVKTYPRFFEDLDKLR